MIVFSVLAVCFIFLGTTVKSDLVWGLQDMLNQLMVLPNVVALLVLSQMVVETSRK